MSRQFDYAKNPRMIYNVKEHLNLLGKLGVTIGSRFNSSINGSNEIPCFESLQLSRVRWISDGPSRFSYVTCVISDA